MDRGSWLLEFNEPEKAIRSQRMWSPKIRKSPGASLQKLREAIHHEAEYSQQQYVLDENAGSMNFSMRLSTGGKFRVCALGSSLRSGPYFQLFLDSQHPPNHRLPQNEFAISFIVGLGSVPFAIVGVL